MKRNYNTFAIVIAVFAVVMLVLQLLDAFHLLSGQLVFNGHQIFNFSSSESWYWIPILNSWWAWLTKIACAIFLIVVWSNKRKDEKEAEERAKRAKEEAAKKA